jgi:hypothetical protein
MKFSMIPEFSERGCVKTRWKAIVVIYHFVWYSSPRSVSFEVSISFRDNRSLRTDSVQKCKTERIFLLL